MSSPKASATSGSIAIAGNSTGDLFAFQNPTFNLTVEQVITRALPMYLSSIVAQFASDLTTYGDSPSILLPPEFAEKLNYNRVSMSHLLVTDYTYYFAVLEQVYKGVEQQNPDVRRMVRRRISQRYSDVLERFAKQESLHMDAISEYVRANAVALMKALVQHLMEDYASSEGTKMVAEVADLAISLLVVDAAVNCSILERPPVAVTT